MSEDDEFKSKDEFEEAIKRDINSDFVKNKFKEKIPIEFTYYCEYKLIDESIEVHSTYKLQNIMVATYNVTYGDMSGNVNLYFVIDVESNYTGDGIEYYVNTYIDNNNFELELK